MVHLFAVGVVLFALPGSASLAPTGAAVHPIVECVATDGGGTYVASFGYLNEHSEAVAIPVGPNNGFTPPPRNRGQTTVFQPGRVRHAFAVPFDARRLVWHLRGPDRRGRRSRTSKWSPVCAPPTITATATPAAGPSGWNTSSVTVTFTCTPGGGIPIASCPAAQVVDSEGAHQTVTGTVTDAAGRSAIATIVLNLDMTAPTLAVDAPPDGASVTTPEITVSGLVVESLSGLAAVTCNDAAATVTNSQFSCAVPLAPGENAVVVRAVDVAGNSVSRALTVSLVPEVAPPTVHVTSEVRARTAQLLTITSEASDP